MGNITHFTDLEAWKINHELVLLIYKTSSAFPIAEKFGLTSQLRRAASSITANLAEGWGRFHFPDKVRFFHLARGSNMETQNHLILARDLGYLKEKEYISAMRLAEKGCQILNGLIRSTEKFR